MIEPTGLAALSGILDTLSCDGIRESIDIRSIICLLDPKRFQTDINVPTTWDQVEAADVLLANKTDLAKPEEIDVFNRWAKGSFHLGDTSVSVFRKIPNELLDLVNGRETEIRHGGHAHGTDHVHTYDEPTIPIMTITIMTITIMTITIMTITIMTITVMFMGKTTNITTDIHIITIPNQNRVPRHQSCVRRTIKSFIAFTNLQTSSMGWVMWADLVLTRKLSFYSTASGK